MYMSFFRGQVFKYYLLVLISKVLEILLYGLHIVLGQTDNVYWQDKGYHSWNANLLRECI